MKLVSHSFLDLAYLLHIVYAHSFGFVESLNIYFFLPEPTIIIIKFIIKLPFLRKMLYALAQRTSNLANAFDF